MKIFIVFIFQLLSLAGWAQPVLVPFKTKAGKWQLVEKYTTTKVLGDFDEIDYLWEGIYQVWKDRKVGLVDVTGKQIKEFPGSRVLGFTRNATFLVNRNGEVLKLFDQRVKIDCDQFGRYIVKRDNRTCVYDSSDHELFCIGRDSILQWGWGYPLDTKEGFKIYDSKAKKEGYINNKGEMLVPCAFDAVWYYPDLGIWMVKDDEKYIFYYTDEKGNRYIEQ